MVGAAILRHHYKRDAVPISGAAAFAVNDKGAIIATFGKVENGELICADDGFHCWVQCDGIAIDFMAPLFQESLRDAGFECLVQRRMFQRALRDMNPSMFSLYPYEGAFHLVPDRVRTSTMIANFNAKNVSVDLGEICLYWYKRPPKRIDSALDMKDDLGNITRLTLGGPEISGVW